MIIPRLSTELKRVARACGLDIQRSANTLFEARRRAIRKCGTDLILDVGANIGQYGDELRRGGYQGRIVSFEPLAEAHRCLVEHRKNDALWQSRNVALGSRVHEGEILEAKNSFSSSLLPVTSISIQANSGTEQVRKTKISVQRLDSIFDEIATVGSSVMLKIDTQGYELEVLRGAESSLKSIDVVECELSLREVYSGQPLFFEVSRYLYDHGFFAVWIERGFQGPHGELLQSDALFMRDKFGPHR